MYMNEKVDDPAGLLLMFITLYSGPNCDVREEELEMEQMKKLAWDYTKGDQVISIGTARYKAKEVWLTDVRGVSDLQNSRVANESVRR